MLTLGPIEICRIRNQCQQVANCPTSASSFPVLLHRLCGSVTRSCNDGLSNRKAWSLQPSMHNPLEGTPSLWNSFFFFSWYSFSSSSSCCCATVNYENWAATLLGHACKRAKATCTGKGRRVYFRE
ncbi:hypothetical protein CEXT_656431 [Caerostris extrusa]|uniref:Uncharacterized protein n=1 Tax=Caerostris extrusa TaxID=172846 RepID=A0AAV4UGA2_CAEEX|nr:hypothetical protein CEXT_656431 [Caerostris extrusa]